MKTIINKITHRESLIGYCMAVIIAAIAYGVHILETSNV
jgi:hypothetical protein